MSAKSGSDPVRKGGCLCGAVRFEITQRLRPVVACHCKQCRQTSGYLAGFTVCDPDNLHFIRDEGLTWYQSSDFAKRGFCKTCGSSLFWTELRGGDMSIAPGSLDEPTNLKTAMHIFTKFAGDYYDLTDDLPKRPLDMFPEDDLKTE